MMTGYRSAGSDGNILEGCTDLGVQIVKDTMPSVRIVVKKVHAPLDVQEDFPSPVFLADTRVDGFSSFEGVE